MKQGWVSILMTVVLLLLSLLLVKLQISILGIEFYGVLTLLLSIFGTINLMNFGFGSALVKSYSLTNDKTQYWGLLIILSSFFFLVSFTILLITSPFYANFYSFVGIKKEIGLNLLSFIGIGLIGISRLLGTIISSYWQAKIIFFKLKLFNFLNTYISISIILVLVFFKVNINTILFTSGIVNILFVTLLTLFLLYSNAQKLSVIKMITLKDIKVLSLDSKDFFLIQITNNLLNPIINIGLAKNLGMEAVSLFDIANKFLRAGRQIIVSYSEPFFGIATKFLNEKKHLKLKNEFIKNSKIMLAFSMAYIIFGFLFSNYIVSLWVGTSIANQIDYVIKIILIGFGINIATSIIYYYFLAEKAFRKYVVIHQFIQLAILSLIFVLPLSTLNNFANLFSFAFLISGIYIIIIAFFKKNKFVIKN